MEVVAGPLEWTFVDEQRWAEFLSTETGKRVIPTLAERVPELLGGGEINAVLIRSGEVRGYQSALRTLLELAQSKESAKQDISTTYPPLEDDTAWNDGQKLTPTPKENA